MKKLLIDSSTQKADLFDGNTLLKSYVISTAKNGLGCKEGSFCTPIGKHVVSEKIGGALPVKTILKGRLSTSKLWSENDNTSDDLVLTRILWLEGVEKHNGNTKERYIYLHGTNHENMLGQAVSHGCVRFSNLDIIDVFDCLDVGDAVEIL